MKSLGDLEVMGAVSLLRDDDMFTPQMNIVVCSWLLNVAKSSNFYKILNIVHVEKEITPDDKEALDPYAALFFLKFNYKKLEFKFSNNQLRCEDVISNFKPAKETALIIVNSPKTPCCDSFLLFVDSVDVFHLVCIQSKRSMGGKSNKADVSLELEKTVTSKAQLNKLRKGADNKRVFYCQSDIKKFNERIRGFDKYLSDKSVFCHFLVVCDDSCINPPSVDLLNKLKNLKLHTFGKTDLETFYGKKLYSLLYLKSNWD